MDDNGARALTRFTLIATLLVSIVANVTHAILAQSEITLWLRIPGGVLWPVLTFLAIEIIVRTVWEQRFTHYLSRTFVLGPAIPALIISYNHQYDLMRMMGETRFLSALAPLAIDGLMIGCTLALLFTAERVAPLAAPAEAAEVEAEHPVTSFEEIARNFEAKLDAYVLQPAQSDPGVFSTDSRMRRMVEALQAGMSASEAAEFTSYSPSHVRNYKAVLDLLIKDPEAGLPEAMAKRVKPQVVESMREWARMEMAK